MPLMLQENFTVKLLEMLRTGELDCAILAEPFPDTGLAIAPLYDEPFMAAVPMSHPLAKRKTITAEELKQRDHAAARHRPLLSRPCARGLPRVRALLQRCRRHPQELRGQLAGDHQAHGGLGHGRHRGAAAERADAQAQPHVRYIPFAPPVPTRRVVLAWRRSFTRYEAIAALRNAVYACKLDGVTRLS